MGNEGHMFRGIVEEVDAAAESVDGLVESNGVDAVTVGVVR